MVVPRFELAPQRRRSTNGGGSAWRALDGAPVDRNEVFHSRAWHRSLLCCGESLRQGETLASRDQRECWAEGPFSILLTKLQRVESYPGSQRTCPFQIWRLQPTPIARSNHP